MIIRIIFTLLMVISFSCEVSRPQGYSSNDNSTTLGLLDRLRSIPGLRIGGVGERDAQVYLRGQTSIKYYQEVVFYVNGARVGNYSSAYQVVQPENIDSIKLLLKLFILGTVTSKLAPKVALYSVITILLKLSGSSFITQ